MKGCEKRGCSVTQTEVAEHTGIMGRLLCFEGLSGREFLCSLDYHTVLRNRKIYQGLERAPAPATSQLVVVNTAQVRSEPE